MTETRALLKGLTEITARAGHDMVGPLNQARSLLALFINRYKGKIDSDADRLLEFLQSASLQMEGVAAGVQAYLDSARTPQRGPVELDALLAGALAVLKAQIAASGGVIASHPMPRALVDAALIGSVFEQVVGNALKFRDQTRPQRIEISAERVGDMLQVTVVDQGIGIDPESYEMVFLPFNRLNGREYPGAGLGLPMARTIVQMHGGAMEAGPRPDGKAGVSVRFTVPPA